LLFGLSLAVKVEVSNYGVKGVVWQVTVGDAVDEDG
jgi:hypothetical protein